jgi:predicted HicB family RNase H-like nuclease
MPAVKGRSKRPTGSATVTLQGRVPENVRDAARAAADAAGISMAAYLEALILTDAEQHLVRPAQEYRQEAISA